jgi:hypothetical protein
MSSIRKYSILLGLIVSFSCKAQVKILFDATKAQTAGNADWVIDADTYNLSWNPSACVSCGNEANPQKIPTPAQSGITASTPETYWSGSLSNWGIDCVKRGYTVETLPYNGQITYGNLSNAQDLSHYKVFIIDEPNIMFTAAEKTAIMNFVKNGGGLFMISDHDVSDRNGDGYDSPTIWNDLIQNNSVQNNAFGFSFDLANFSQTSSNVLSSATDSILHGPMGNVTQVKWSNGTSMTLNTSQNSTVKGVVFQTGASTAGSNSVMCAYSRWYAGKVGAIGDSSPPDDGTGDPNDALYNGYTLDAAGNHQRLIMNMTIWLALGGSVTTEIEETGNNTDVMIYPNPANTQFNLSFAKPLSNGTIEVRSANGSLVATENNFNGQILTLNTSEYSNGIYFVNVNSGASYSVSKMVVIH